MHAAHVMDVPGDHLGAIRGNDEAQVRPVFGQQAIGAQPDDAGAGASDAPAWRFTGLAHAQRDGIPQKALHTGPMLTSETCVS